MNFFKFHGWKNVIGFYIKKFKVKDYSKKIYRKWKWWFKFFNSDFKKNKRKEVKIYFFYGITVTVFAMLNPL